MKASNKNISSYRTGQFVVAVAACAALSQLTWADPNTNFTNTGSIANTRHNLSHSTLGAGIISQHNPYRNNYGEVCVYCHTPHGANNTVAAPLWNRTIKVTDYQTYDELGTTSLTQAVTPTPGSASLTCLSCHDGQTAIDSIINMPGSGKGLISQETTQNTVFLNSWDNPPPGPAGNTTSHRGINSTNNLLGNGTGSDGRGCLTCHSPLGAVTVILDAGEIANDMRLFNLGTDLRNDHPIGVTFPVDNGVGTDWNTPAGLAGTSNFFDAVAQGGNGDGRMNKNEIRTYDGRVECASCHDPHGVPGVGGVFKPTFLRKDNSAGSATCLTCHNK